MEKAESAINGGKLNLERKQPATIELMFGDGRSMVPVYPVNWSFAGKHEISAPTSQVFRENILDFSRKRKG